MRGLLACAAVIIFAVGPIPAASASVHGHWNDLEPTFPRGYAYVQDLTPAAWPVYTAAIDWDRASKLDLVYRSGANGCVHCIPFDDVPIDEPGCSAAPGVTRVQHASSNHLYDVSSQVDTGCAANSYNNRLELVCHEMGHAIGLNDRGSTAASCMRTNVPLGNETKGSNNDFVDLLVEYSHDS